MKTWRVSGNRFLRRTVLGVGAIAFWMAPVPAGAQQIDPEADRILRAMSDYMSGLPAFTVDYDTDSEIVDIDGQKLQYGASGSVAVERPGRMRITRKGAFADMVLTFDGKTISVLGKAANVYGQLESPGPSIDEAVEEVRAATGFDASGADLFTADSHAVLTEDATKGIHVGTGVVGGVECEHLAFRNPRVDWQVWVQTGDRPLPVKYVITSKWIAGAPQYALRLANWNVSPQIDPAQFTFTPPAGANRLEAISADALGEMIEEEAQ